MRSRLRRWAAAAAVAALLAAPTRGLGERWRYGGSRADALNEVIAAPGGYLAVGTTQSDDGDLSLRSRTGRTGWALFIREDGAPMWSLCSARGDLARMSAPLALEDGGFSLVLADETGQRGEWIVTDERGRAQTRVPVPDPQALIPDGKPRTVAAMTPVQTQEGAMLVIALEDGEGALTPVALDADGHAEAGERIEGGAQGRAAANAHGEYAWVAARDGGIAVARLEGRRISGAQGIALDAPVQGVCDALMQEDGSVTFAAAFAQGGAILRVSAAGDVLFRHDMRETPLHITQTQTGFAAYAQGGGVTFLDEDGALLERRDGLPGEALDIVGAPGGAALLLREGGSGEQEAVLMTVEQTVFTAREEPERTPAPQATPLTVEARAQSGHVQCENVPGGVRVTRVDAAGERVFETKIPIQTAADALVWQCALPLEGGGMALGGCYVYGEGAGAQCSGALALLDGEGVLRRIEEIEEIGCVLALAQGAGGALTLDVATQKRVGAQADGQMTLTP